MYCLIKDNKPFTYFSELKDCCLAYCNMKNKKVENIKIGSNFDPKIPTKFTYVKEEEFVVYKEGEGFVPVCNTLKPILRLKDMTKEQRKKYYEERGMTTKSPYNEKKEDNKKQPKPPSELELRNQENGTNMFRWSLSFYDLTCNPVVTKTIWNLDHSNKITYIHEGISPLHGFKFVCYDVSKDNAIKRVKDYINNCIKKGR